MNTNVLFATALAGLVGIAGCATDTDSLGTLRGAIVAVDGGETCVTLYAGQHIDAGSVCVSVAGDDLVVTYQTSGDWGLTETHLWIGTSLLDLPRTQSGNPQLGLFPYKAEDLDDATSYTFTVPIAVFLDEDEVCDATLYLVAHAAMRRPDGEGGFQTETGYGDGPRLVQRGNWATYFSVTLTCEDDGGGEGGGCETAYAYGDHTFIDLGITQARWGWEITIAELGPACTPLYAGAGQNDISKGTHVGTVCYDYDGATLDVSYDLFDGFGLAETHVYAGCTEVATIAPGQYGNAHGDLDGAASDGYSIALSCDELPAFLVAHAVVCEG
jgi:hypothetical protein